ncbi:MAG: pilus assembly protein PilM [Candidatus Zixiibacteriota bacterium]
MIVETRSVQLACVSHFGLKRKLVDVRKVYLPSDLADPTQKRAFIGDQIRAYAKSLGCSRCPIRMAVSGRDTAFRIIHMPNMKKSLLDSALQFEAAKQIPFPIDQTVFEYSVLQRIAHEGSINLRIGLLAATRKELDHQLDVMDDMSEQVDCIYHTQDVVGQLLSGLTDFAPDRQYTLMLVGFDQSEIAFYRGTNLEFWHVISAGSHLLGNQPDRTRYEYFAELIASELQISFDYYTGHFSGSLSNRIYLYGDLTYSSELAERLNGFTSFQFERFPASQLDIVREASVSIEESLPVCLIGLAAAACNTTPTNLLPGESKRQHKVRRADHFARMAIAALALLLFVQWFWLSEEVSLAKRNLNSLDREVIAFTNSEAYHTYNTLKRSIALDKAYLDRIRETPDYLSLNLKELTHLLVPEIRLYNLEYLPKEREDNLLLQGLVSSRDIPPEIILAELVENLSASPFFERVAINRHVKRDQTTGPVIDFTLRMQGII